MGKRERTIEELDVEGFQERLFKGDNDSIR